jgi:hypothetical protein
MSIILCFPAWRLDTGKGQHVFNRPRTENPQELAKSQKMHEWLKSDVVSIGNPNQTRHLRVHQSVLGLSKESCSGL